MKAKTIKCKNIPNKINSVNLLEEMPESHLIKIWDDLGNKYNEMTLGEFCRINNIPIQLKK